MKRAREEERRKTRRELDSGWVGLSRVQRKTHAVA